MICHVRVGSCTATYQSCMSNAASFPAGVMEVSEHEVKEWISPKDLGIGKTINIMGRKFLLLVAHTHTSIDRECGCLSHSSSSHSLSPSYTQL